jgi:hypothetical protein
MANRFAQRIAGFAAHVDAVNHQGILYRRDEETKRRLFISI